MNASGLLRVICERLSSGENCVTELEAQLGVEAIAAVLYENGAIVCVDSGGRLTHNRQPDTN